MLLRRDAHEARLEMYTVLACLSKTCPKQASREPRFYHFSVTREAPTTDNNMYERTKVKMMGTMYLHSERNETLKSPDYGF